MQSDAGRTLLAGKPINRTSHFNGPNPLQPRASHCRGSGVLDLEPVRDPTRAIARAEPLGHDAFAAKFASVFEHDVAVAFIEFVEHDTGMRAAHQLRQLGLALFDGRSSQILAIQLDEIEGAQHRPGAIPMPAD